MLLDHLATFGLIGALEVWQAIGRIAFPLFGFVLGMNLAERGGAAALKRAAPKMLLAGLVAQPLTTWLTGQWMPNVMFTLALGAWLAWPQLSCWPEIERAAVFVLACTLGLWVEFSIVGVFFVWACARWAERKEVWQAGVWLLALAALGLVNANLYALAALGPIGAAWLWGNRWRLQRWAPGWLYVFYPAHLAAIAALSIR